MEDRLVSYNELNEHWKIKSKYDLDRQAAVFKKKFEFEINEGILSLDQKYPDISMALSRLNHMRDYLKEL